MGIFIGKKTRFVQLRRTLQRKKIPGQVDINNKSPCQQISMFEV